MNQLGLVHVMYLPYGCEPVGTVTEESHPACNNERWRGGVTSSERNRSDNGIWIAPQLQQIPAVPEFCMKSRVCWREAQFCSINKVPPFVILDLLSGQHLDSVAGDTRNLPVCITSVMNPSLPCTASSCIYVTGKDVPDL